MLSMLLILLTPPAEVVPTLKTVSFDELIRAVKAHQGKVVVVDFWDNGCGECKKEFPHLVQMYRDLKDQGLVCIAVSLDSVDDADAIAGCNEFVKQQRAAFEQYLLNESIEGWQKKLGIWGPPAVFVFGRDGKLARAFKPLRTEDNPDAKVAYPGMIEPFVKTLLKQPGN